MSINVTVTGSPVSIKRGRMVTADCDASKKDFERRRLIRLEQVRQQSKDIAENVRNRVRKEKTKQQSQLEKQGEVQLKQWQARKLLELQNQYQEALDDLGLGHKEARAVELEEEHLLVDMKESNEEVARRRGEIAAERLQIDKNEANLRRRSKERQIIQSRKNNVSSNISNNNRTGKSPFKKRKKSRELVDSDGENQVPVLVDMDDENLGECGYTQRTENNLVKSVRKVSREQQTTPEVKTTDKSAQTLPQPEHHELLHMTTEDPSLNLPPDNRISDRIKRRHYLNSDEVCTCTDLLGENDRIISPQIKSQFPATSATTCPCCQCLINVDSAGKVVSAGAEKPVDQQQQGKSATGIIGPDNEVLREGGKNIPQPATEDDHTTSAPKKDKKIPSKPKITLRSAKEMPESGGHTAGTKMASSKLTANSDAKVKYYDHPNRYSKLGPSTSRLERIDDDNLQTHSPEGAEIDEKEYFERMRQRDIEAHLRGQKAMEKERIHRDYRDLLKKLPVLQKQERLYDISGDRPEYHMPDDRLRELERRRQNRLDNAYESLFERGSTTAATYGSGVRQPALVTLPRRQVQRQDGAAAAAIGSSALNLAELSASWDVDFAKIIGGRSQQPTRKSRNDELLELLENLKAQKNELLKEVQQLPIEPDGEEEEPAAKNDSEKITTKEGADDTAKRKEAKNKRKRSRDDVIRGEAASDVTSDTNMAPATTVKTVSSGTTTTTTSSGANTGKSTLKDSVANSSAATGAPSPRKKPKLKKSPKRHHSSRRKVLILQNTSTQTTPKLDGATDANSQAVPSSQIQLDNFERTDPPAKECPKDKHYSCTCPDLAHDRVCEIRIKINDQDQPEVVVNPPCLGTNVNVVIPASPKKSSKKISQETKSLQNDDTVDKAPSTKTPMVAATTRKSTAPWKLHLSQQSSSLSTASTSYWSPPDFQKKIRSGDSSTDKNSKPRRFPERTAMKKLTPPAIAGSFENSTKSSLDSTTGKMDPRLLTYIKKLLNMSRASIEDLTVSTGSEVSTPSQSIIEMPTNNPLSQLRSVIKYFNIDPLDLQRQLHQSSSSSNETTKHYNTERSVTMPTEPSNDQQQQQMNGEHSTPSLEKSGSRSVGKTGDDKGLIDNGIRDKAKQTVAKYADIAESCNRKISNLTAMIEKVRAEKRKILQSPPTTICGNSGADSNSGDHLTINDKSKPSSVGSTAGSQHDDTTDAARLLEIDLHYAERLKLLTPEELVKEKQRLGQHQSSTNPPLSTTKTTTSSSGATTAQEQELLVRLRRLLETSQLHTSQLQNLQVQTSHLQDISAHGAPSPGRNNNQASEDGGSSNVHREQDKDRASFVPLLDIKKLPKLDDFNANGAATSLDVGVLNKKRPPPSKGMKVMQAVPHELSTIVEATDSLVSTRLETRDKDGGADSRNNSNDRSGRSDRSSDSIPDILSHIVAEEPSKSPQKKAKSPQKMNKGEEKSPNDRSSGSASKPASLTNNSTSPGADKSDGDAMEVMLHSIGMEWAIPTLRKTREALAMASTSSNSSDKSKNNQDGAGGGGGSHNNSTDVSLREFLARHLSLNSSGGVNNYSPSGGGLNFGSSDVQEISGVYLRRTSTPVQQQQQSGGGGGSAEKSDRNSADSRSRTSNRKSREDRDVVVQFGGESEDLSSVRNEDAVETSATKTKANRRDSEEPNRFYDLQEESTVSNNKTMG